MTTETRQSETTAPARTTPLPSVMWNGQDEDRKAANEHRAAERGLESCAICGRGVKPGSAWVVTVTDGGGAILHPSLDTDPTEVNDRGFMGSWVLGPECGKHVPLDYRTKWSGWDAPNARPSHAVEASA